MNMLRKLPAVLLCGAALAGLGYAAGVQEHLPDPRLDPIHPGWVMVYACGLLAAAYLLLTE